jgi:hypothetical protein
MAPLCRGNVVTLLRTQSETSQRAFPRLLHPTPARVAVDLTWARTPLSECAGVHLDGSCTDLSLIVPTDLSHPISWCLSERRRVTVR